MPLFSHNIMQIVGFLTWLVYSIDDLLFSGPGLNLFLRLLDFDIGSFHVDKYNAPGVCIFYLLLLHNM